MKRGQRLVKKPPHKPPPSRASAGIEDVFAGALRHHQAGRLNEAAQLYRQVLAVEPRHADSLHLLGVVSHLTGRQGLAVSMIGEAIAINPKVACFHSDLGNVLREQGQPNEAIACLRRAIDIAPEYPEAHHNLGIALGEQGRTDEAIICYRRAVDLRPDYSEAHNNLAIAVGEQGRADEAIVCFRRVVDLKPDQPQAHISLGNALARQRQLDQSIACYRRAIELEPDHAEAHSAVAMVLLARADMEAGWEEYEWRWNTSQLFGARRNFAQPQWRGEAASGLTLLIHAEQGFGDTLQFCRYAALAVARGFRVILEVQPPLVRLLRGLQGVDLVIARGEALPTFDLHCPMLSLPLAMGTTITTIPGAVPYLRVSDTQVAAWQARLNGIARPGLRVGLVWAGKSRDHWPDAVATDRRRSLPPNRLAPLFDLPGLHFVSLQRDGPAAPTDFRLTDFMHEMADFADTAALIANLDLVVSVDTAVAHLAGALGKPVWLLDRFDSCWRWLMERQDSPWYPTLRLYRQTQPGDWDRVLADVVRDLRWFVEANGNCKATARRKAPSRKEVFADALKHHRAGDLSAAERLYRQILEVKPRHADSLHLLGVVSHQKGHHDLAVDMINRAIAIDGKAAAFHSNLGAALKELGRLEEAAASFVRALDITPESPEAHCGLGDVRSQQERCEEAIASYRQALNLKPGYVEAHYNLGGVLKAEGRLDEAVACYRQALDLRPDFADAHANLGGALKDLAQLSEAVACYRRALDLKPDLAEAHNNLGNLLAEQGGLDEAIECYRRVLSIQPDHPATHNNLGNALRGQRQLEEATVCARRVLEIKPDLPEGHFNLGITLLTRGEMPAGWAEYEWRWKTAEFMRTQRNFAQPRWRGEAADGQRLLIHAEQGFGDTLQFCRYASIAAATGLRVILEVQKPLVRLLRGLAGVELVVAAGDQLPEFDLQCPMLSMPLALGTTISTIPGGAPYLHAAEAQVMAWRTRLAAMAKQGPRIGVVWAGDPNAHDSAKAAVDRRRSIGPDCLAPLYDVPRLHFISLQKQGPAAPAEFPLTDFMHEMMDFADTAALIANLDLVISVDTAVAHLASALGKPVWLLDRFDSCWRWLTGRRDSPWYPALRLYRQPRPGDWESVVADVTRDLRSLVEDKERHRTAKRRPVLDAAPPIQAVFADALQHHRAGRLNEAKRLYKLVLATDGRHTDSLHLLGVVDHQMGRHASAADLIGQAIAINPEVASFHANMAAALKEQGRLDDAVACLRRAIDLKPDYADAYTSLAILLRQQGRLEEAVECRRRTRDLRPDLPEAHNDLGNALTAQGRLEEAVACFRAALDINTGYPGIHINLGSAFKELGRLDEAIASYRIALALKPNLPAVHNNLGSALGDQEQLDEAVACYRQALDLKPDFADAHNNLGAVLWRQGMSEEAMGRFRTAIDLRADFPEAHNNLAMALLALGDLAAGWPEYEWRWKLPLIVRERRHFAQPQWRGETAEGQTLLIHAEQGFGDTLQFCRFASLAAEKGLRVILQVQKPLVRLLRTLSGVDLVVGEREALPAFDLHCPMLSLPLALGTTIPTIPAAASYLHADPGQVEMWRTRLEAMGNQGCRIGLVWAGNPRVQVASAAVMDRRRSLPPERLTSLFDVPGAHFFSLQKDCPPASVTFPLTDFMQEVTDFADTAALVANLDLVICVDTAVAHLAGALGKAVLLLNRFDSCWRWLRARRDSPWYPALRLYHQPRAGDWDSVLDEVARDLRNLVEDHNQRRAAQTRNAPDLEGRSPPIQELLADAVRHHRAGNLDRAEPLYLQVLAVDPSHADCLHLLGMLAQQTGRHARAVDLMGRAIAIDPDIAFYHADLGRVHREQGRLDDSVIHLRRAIDIEPRYPEAHASLALTLWEQERAADAVASYQRAVELKPDYPEAHANLAVLLEKQGRPAEAVVCYRRVVALRPDQPEAQLNLGNALAHQGLLHEAVGCYHLALDLKPDYPEAHNSLGSALAHQGLQDQAVVSYRTALDLRQDYPEAHYNLGIARKQQRKPDEAIECYRRALSLRPAWPEARTYLAMALLAQGDMAAGWEEYEWRWKLPTALKARRDFARPRWQGEAAEGRTLLIHAEQGFGDTLQFCRYAQLAAANGWRVILEVQKPLVRLLRGLPGVDVVVARGEQLPEFDLYCPMVSMPWAMRTIVTTIPAAARYLHADEAQVARWRTRLAAMAHQGFRVGLVWAGNPRADKPDAAAMDRRRSLALDLLAPLLDVSGVHFFSLQKDSPAAPAGFALTDLMHEMADFADTAALVANLDLVISVDTAVAHLAAALGRPVWLLDRFDSCWRWLTGRRDSPWYPTLRIYRQPRPSDWHSVLDEAARDLRSLAEGRGYRQGEATQGTPVMDGTSPPIGAVFAEALQHHRAGHLTQAEQLYRQVLEADSRHADSLHLLGVVTHQTGRHDAAVDLIRDAISINPGVASFHANLAAVLNALGRVDDAIGCLRAAIDLKPDYPDAFASLGKLLRELGRLDEAEDVYRRAVALRPDLPDTHNDLGNVLRAQGRPDEAVSCFRRALHLKADLPGVHNNLAMALLAQGDMATGWEEYEWRWKTSQLIGVRRNFRQPQWRGEAATGQTLLIHAEQGFGDTLQFCRYAPLASASGLQVILEVAKPLVRLLRSLPGVDLVVEAGEPLPPFDLHCPMLSMPLAYRTSITTIPSAASYLRADEAMAASWRARLDTMAIRGPRIGLVWAGKPEAAYDRRRSLAPDLLAPLLDVPGVHFFSLQKDGPVAPATLPLTDFMQEMTDFADTAALIANLDLVISVDTAVAHLAAALGKPVWLLDRFDSCWRWLTGRPDSPWYPSLRLYRQPRPGDWDPALAEIGRDLRSLAEVHERCRTNEAHGTQVMENAPRPIGEVFDEAMEHHQAGRLNEAKQLYRQVLAVDPRHPDSLHLLGLVTHELGGHELGIEMISEAIAIAPGVAFYHSNLANILRKQERLDDAIDSLRRAVDIAPEVADGYFHLGSALIEGGRRDEGIISYRKAIELKPDFMEAHNNLGLALLARGDMAAGWAGYEWRWKSQAMIKCSRNFPQPQWRGEAGLGRTLLITIEGGHGDTIQFCRYAPLATAYGVRVILEVQRPLLRLLRGLPGVDQVVVAGEPLPEFDIQCPLLSMPFAMRSMVTAIPSVLSYLEADTAQVAAWRTRLAAIDRQGPRIGLVWAGNPSIGYPALMAMDRQRTMAPDLLAPLLAVAGLHFFSLQKHGPPMSADVPLTDFMPEMTDFADTAALISNLDLVISVDTAVAHLAAGLGKPVWMLNRFDSCWRWLTEGHDSAWYPTLRLYRQHRPGDWTSVVAEVARDLRNLAGGDAPQPAKAPAAIGTIQPVSKIFTDALRHHRAGRLNEAERLYRRALTMDSRNADSLHLLGVVHHQMGRHALAADMICEAITINATVASYHSNLGAALKELGRPQEAIASYHRAINLKPSFPEAHYNIGNVLKEEGRHDEAIASYRTAIRFRPGHPEAHYNLGGVLKQQERGDEAVACFYRALDIDPNYAEAHNILGNALRERGRLDEAVACYGKALDLKPAFPEAHTNRAMALLALGDMAAAWQEYEWRWKLPQSIKACRNFPQPLWRGEAASGRTLLIHAEQGFGDTIQFCRYASLAAASGLRVILEVQRPLVRLLRGLVGVDLVVGADEQVPAFDFHCPMLSLPLALRTTIATIPAATRYLQANEAQVAAWQTRLAATTSQGPRIGLVWAGNPRIHLPNAAATDRRRSLAPERLAPLFDIPGLQFFSLQKNGPAAPVLFPLTDLMHEMTDFADTAAFIANLDLVISVDTSMVHLTASLGKQVWMLDRFDPCWRWLVERRDSPWYPTLCIYRQPQPGDWDSVLADVAQDLRSLACEFARVNSLAIMTP